MVTRWISAKEAIRLVAIEYEQSDPDLDFNSALIKAETALLTRLRHGALKSAASTLNLTIYGASPWGEEDNDIAAKNDEVAPVFWRYISSSNGWGEEWVSGDFTIELNHKSASGAAFNVHFDADSLPGLTASPIAAPVIMPEPMSDSAPSRGRPVKWDWDAAMAHMVALANHLDGLDALADGPFRQADLERELSNWFIAKTGNSPTTSQIRARASSIMQAIAEVEKSKRNF